MEAHPSYESLVNYAAGDSLDEENHIALCLQCRATVSRFRRVSAIFRADDSVMPPVATLVRAYALYHPRRSIPSAPASPLFQFKHGFAAIALAVIFFCAGALFAQNSPFSISVYIVPKEQAPVTVVIGVPIHTPLATRVQEFIAPEVSPTFVRPSLPEVTATPVLPKSTDAPTQVPVQTTVPQLPTAVIPSQATPVPLDMMAPISRTDMVTTSVPPGSTGPAPSNTSSEPAPSNTVSEPPPSAPPEQPPSEPTSPPPSAPPEQPPSEPTSPPPSAPPVPPKPPPSTWLTAPVQSP